MKYIYYILILFFCSCSIEKKRYSSGYYIEWPQPNKSKKPSNLQTCIHPIKITHIDERPILIYVKEMPLVISRTNVVEKTHTAHLREKYGSSTNKDSLQGGGVALLAGATSMTYGITTIVGYPTSFVLGAGIVFTSLGLLIFIIGVIYIVLKALYQDSENPGSGAGNGEN